MAGLRTTGLAGIIVVLLGTAIGASFAHGQASSTTQAAPPQAAKGTAVPGTPPSVEDTLSTYEGQNVTAVSIAGQPDAQSSQFESSFIQKAGTPFSKDKIEQTVEAVKAQGHFTDVQLRIDPEPNGVRVLLVLEPAVSFGLFEFPGAEQFAFSRLAQVSNYPPEAPFNADDLEQDRKSLLRFFRQEGFFQAEVTPEVKVDAANRIANIYFNTKLNKKAKFGTIDFGTLAPAEAQKLDKSLQTFIARARGVAIRKGKTYHRSTLTKATQYITNKLEKDDRLGARVRLAGAEYDATTNLAKIHFDINEGPLTHVEVDGAHLFSWTKKSLLPIYQGIGVDDESVQEGRQALVSYFQAKGFFDVTVDASLNRASAGDTVVYKIDREKKHKVKAVNLSGNTSVPGDRLTPTIAVEKSHLFSPGKYSEKLVRTSVKNLEAVYASEGFSSAKVVSKVDNHGGDIQISFRVTEGPRDIVSSLQIDGADTFPKAKYAPDGLKLGEGKPYSQALVEKDRANIVANYLKAGYLTSSFRQTATVVSKQDPHHINVVYHIYEGPQVFADKIITLGRKDTRQRLIDEDIASIKSGQPLTETELLTAESQLYNHTGVFDWAEVDPKETITTQTKEDVLIKVHEAKKNQMTYGFGFEVINRGGSVPSGTVVVPGLPPVGLPSSFETSQKTFYGPRGSFQYTRNNLRGKGESASFTAFAGRLDQRIGLYYIDPNFRWSKWRGTTSFNAERNEENPIYSSQQELGSLQFQRALDKAKLVQLFLRYSFSKTDLTRVVIPNLVLAADQHVRLSTLAANITKDSRDNPLDEHKGWLKSIELAFNDTKLGSSVDFMKFNGQLAYYKQGFHGIVFANSLRVGLAQPFSGSRVPLSEAFFTGGGSTLRGFPLDGAGPQRSVEVCPNGTTGCMQFINVPSGGNELLLINEEARIPLPLRKGLGIAVFYDGGNVFPTVGFHDFGSLYSNNVGVGLRYATPVGPVRIDLGRNLNPITGVDATQYFISIGQAF